MARTLETVLEIDLNALEHNYRFLRSRLNPETKFLGVVKAFAYGSDAVEIAKKLDHLGVEYLAVAYVKEGVALRDAGIQTPFWYFIPSQQILKNLLHVVLSPVSILQES